VAESPLLAILGATGYTGALVVERAREAGLPLRLVGRRRDALERIARNGEEIRVADARDEAALIAAFDGAFAVASLAGPFLAIGPRPVAAAIAVGAHYLDTSGEQAFARLVYEGFGDSAFERGVVLLTSFGFDYVPGDLAARLAAEQLDEPLDEVVAAYSVKRMGLSPGTRRTIGHVMTQPLVAYENGLVDSRFGKTTRRIRFPFGERTVVEWSGTEPLTVPRHTRVRTVRSYVRAPAFAARTAPLAALAAPLVRRTGRLGGGPSEERRRRNRFTVVGEARGPGGARRATLTGSDVYALTALLIVRGAEALRRGDARSAGALAPAEAFDARTFADALAPLLQVDSVEPI
jgi:short subunit dehydrogenase-like uncharacterized protein